MSERLLKVKGLKTYFHTFKGIVRAVDGIDFSLDRGEILGIVGESGGGKSVTGFSIINLLDSVGKIEDGEVLFEGEDITKKSEEEMTKIRGKDISMIFQDPMTSLNPLYTVQNQIEEVLKLHKNMSPKEMKMRCIELLNMVGISNPEQRLKSYPHQFSGGMRQRVVIAIALAAEPKLIIADEPTTALDVTVQLQILKLMKKLVRDNNSSLILITHDLAVVSQMVDRAIVMYCGKIVEQGSIDEIIKRPSHPYTIGLLNSIPRIDKDNNRLEQIPGIVPSMFNLPRGCNFSSRCSYCGDICINKEPEIKHISDKHGVACHFPVKEVESL